MFYRHPWARRYAYACAETFFPQTDARSFYETRSHRPNFGVRRPLRFLSYHLDLDESQRRTVAASFERLKLEREQAKLDRKRADGALADLLTQDGVTAEALRETLRPREAVDAKVADLIARELSAVVAVLDADQRAEFAHLIRTGVIRL